MPTDPREVDVGGVIKDAFGREVVVASTKHAQPAVSDIPTATGLLDSDGHRQIVIEGLDVGSGGTTIIETGGGTTDGITSAQLTAALAGKANLGSGLRRVPAASTGVQTITLTPSDVTVYLGPSTVLTGNVTVFFNNLLAGITIIADYVQPNAAPFYTVTFAQVSGAVPVFSQSANARTRVELLSDGVSVFQPGTTNVSQPSSMTVNSVTFTSGT